MSQSSSNKPFCSNCGSDKVCFDAYAEWDAEKQEMVLVSTYAHNTCGDCCAADIAVWRAAKTATVTVTETIEFIFPITYYREEDSPGEAHAEHEWLNLDKPNDFMQAVKEREIEIDLPSED